MMVGDTMAVRNSNHHAFDGLLEPAGASEGLKVPTMVAVPIRHRRRDYDIPFRTAKKKGVALFNRVPNIEFIKKNLLGVHSSKHLPTQYNGNNSSCL